MPHRHIGGVLVVALLLLTGCPEDVVVETDTGPDGAADSGVDGGLLIAPPEIPWLADGVPPIVLTPCPEGWREVHGGAVTECDPYPEGGPETCGPGEAHFMGEPGCRPIGDPCPSGDYATDLPSEGPVVYVKAGAAAGGDGTVAMPFARLADVPWPTLAPSTTVALAKGSYPGTAHVPGGITVTGACVAETILTGTDDETVPVVWVASGAGAALVQNLAIRDTLQRSVVVSYGRRLSLRGVLVEGARDIGVFGGGFDTLSLTDVVVRGTVARESGGTGYGIGLHLEGGLQVEATRLLIEGNHGYGISLLGEGPDVTLTDTVVRDTQPRERDGTGGRGIAVTDAARVEATRLLVSGNHTVGIVVARRRAVMTLTDAIVRDTKLRVSDDEQGHGIMALDGGEVFATRTLIVDTRSTGFGVQGLGAHGVLTDVVIRNTNLRASGEVAGVGVSANFGGQIEATMLLISDCSNVGAFVDGEESVLSLTDAVIRETVSSRVDGLFGRGLSIQAGARLEASRLYVPNSGEMGMMVTDEGTVAELSDVVVRDTGPRDSDGRFGWGIEAQDHARVEGQRLQIEHSVEGGILAFSSSTVVATDVVIHDVAVSECRSEDCVSVQYGHGAGALAGTLSLSRFRVTGAATCGVLIDPEEDGVVGGSLDLEAGEVSGSGIGACVQVDGYDLGRITADVRYTDNAMSLSATSLAVPQPAESAEPPAGL